MYVCVAENGEMLVFSPFFPNNSLNRQLSFRVEVLNHMGRYLGHKGLLIKPPLPDFFCLCAFFKIVYVSLVENNKSISFYEGVCT